MAVKVNQIFNQTLKVAVQVNQIFNHTLFNQFNQSQERLNQYYLRLKNLNSTNIQL